MHYILIDNCSLRDLIDSWGYSKYLPDLENLISNNRITFLTHKLIIEEWNKHKTGWKKEKQKKLLGHSVNGNQSKEGNLLQSSSLVHSDYLQLQINMIDQLLANARIVLDTPPLIMAEFAERFRKRLAPLHNKINGQNDWEIIGSACHFCEMNGIKELFFLSANDTDFEGEPGKIHPDIQERFAAVHVRYHKDFTAFLAEINDLHRIPLSLIGYTLVPNEKYGFQSTIKKNVLDSLCYLYTELYAEIDFIPTHLLRKLYPFSSGVGSHAYFSNFKMNYVSESMADFFSNISAGENGITYKDETPLESIKNYKEKVQYILRKLTANLVFHIDGEKSRKKICTHDFRYVFCECVKCTFDRLEFNKTFRDVQIEQSDYKGKLKQAYMHYKLGNYISANTIYEQIVEGALKEQKLITYFIARYNQQNLSRFLGNFFTNKMIDDALVDRLEKIDPLEEAIKLKTHSDYNLLSYIARQDFFTEAFQEISESVGKIINHYKSQLNGGWASNEEIWKLISTFAELEYFLNSNFIIYDGFLNFERLFEMVTEGLFASYAITESQGERFEKIDNYWITKFIFYGKREAIIRLFNRYQLRDIKYVDNGNSKESFLTVFKNLVGHDEILQQAVARHRDPNNNYFQTKFDLLLENALTMAAILRMDKGLVNQFGVVLISYLEKRRELSHSMEEALKYFVKMKGKSFKTGLKYYLLNYCLSIDNCKYYDLLSASVAAFDDGSLKRLNAKKINILVNNATVSCEKCSSRHGSLMIGNLYKKVELPVKKLIAGKIIAELKNKFDFELFYHSGIFDILPLDKKRLMKLIRDFKHNGNRTIRSLFSGVEDYQNSYADSIINLCFKYSINTASAQFKNIAAIHPYYKWLLNMEKFNYTRFDPEWVLKYGTFYYNRQMAKSKKVKQALETFLKDNNHPGIEKVLLKISVFTK